MKILIAGCGKVGKNIAEELVQEEHDIVLVDSDEKVVSNLCNSLDVIGVIGDAASLTTLKEAGIETADILIADTSSDEVNMLSCLFARKANPKIKTIARVRNPIYSKEISYIKDELGLTLIINPEMATAREIARIIRFPAAMRVETFSRGRVELVSFSIDEDNMLAGKKIMDISKIFNFQILFMGIERGEETIIPNGQTVINVGDIVSIISRPSEVETFFKYIGLSLTPIKNVMIIGGSTTAYYLTSILSDNFDVKIIDSDQKRCEELVELLPKATIINADASDNNVLFEEGIKDTDAFISLTNVDEQNIMLSLYAGNASDAKVITKVNHITFDNVMSKLDIGSTIHPKNIVADNIITYVRGLAAAQNSSNITSIYRLLNNKAEAISFKLKAESRITGKCFKDLKLIDNTLICAIIRNDQVIIPSGKDKAEVGDIVLIATIQKGLEDIEGIIA